MTGAVRQIIEVPCSVDALERSEALAQLTPDAARALGVDAVDGSDLDASMGARIDAAIAACLAAYKPRGVYKLFNPATCTLPPEYVEPAKMCIRDRSLSMRTLMRKSLNSAI